MAATIQASLLALRKILGQAKEGLSASELLAKLPEATSMRTLQRRLKLLREADQLVVQGQTNQARYFLSAAAEPGATWPGEIVLSQRAERLLVKMAKPFAERKKVGYQRKHLDAYLPNESYYLSAQEREELKQLGSTGDQQAPAGTFARQILNKLLVDLAWN